MKRIAGTLARSIVWLPGLYVFAGVACLPDNALREVAAENIVRTTTLITSSFVSLFFLNFFRF